MKTIKSAVTNSNNLGKSNWVGHNPEFHAIFDNNPDAVIIFNSKGNYINANKAALKLFGVSKKDLIGGHFSRFFASSKQAKSVLQNFLTNSTRKAETQLNTADGRQKWVEYSGVANISPGLHICFIRDITVLRQAELAQRQNQVKLKTLVHERTRELRLINRALKNEIKVRIKTEAQLEYQKGKVERQKDRLLAIFDNVDEGVFIQDSHGRITLANQSCLRETGYSLDSIKGKKYYQVFKCQDKNGKRYPDFDSAKEVFKTRKPVPYTEHIHEDRFGTKKWVGVSQTPILAKDGSVHQIVSVVRDITAIKELETAKSEFVSVASHELRTPLTVINGYLSLLLNGDLGSLEEEKGRENFLLILSKVFNETRRLTKLAEELLNVSRIEGGKIRLRLADTSVADIISEVGLEMQSLADEKHINLQIKPQNGAAHCHIMADKDKLKQILMNLIENAIKYTGPNGKVAVSCFLRDSNVLIQIADTGTGIAPQVLPRIFEKFQQGSPSYLKENKGTGLGLFIVKSLVELHHGRIWVKSKLGQGSTFTFSLPLEATGKSLA